MLSFQNLKSPYLKNEILKLKGWLLGWLYNSKNVLLEMEGKTEIRIFWEETHCYIDLLCLLNFGNRFKIASSRLPLSLCVLFYLFYYFFYQFSFLSLVWNLIFRILIISTFRISNFSFPISKALSPSFHYFQTFKLTFFKL